MDEKKKEDTYDKDKKVLAFCHTVSGTGYCNVCADAPTGCGAFRDSAVWASAGGYVLLDAPYDRDRGEEMGTWLVYRYGMIYVGEYDGH